jgi:hypothetical protein
VSPDTSDPRYATTLRLAAKNLTPH